MFSGNYKYFTIGCWTLGIISMWYYLENGGSWKEFFGNSLEVIVRSLVGSI